MDLLSAIRRCALWDVLSSEDDSFRLRRIYRWYSKTFNTPLHEAEKLPIAYVLQHFYEDHYESLLSADKLEELEEERIVLTETEEERKEREKRELEDKFGDEEFARQAEEEMKKKLSSEPLPDVGEAQVSFEETKNKVIQDFTDKRKESMEKFKEALQEGKTLVFDQEEDVTFDDLKDEDKVW